MSVPSFRVDLYLLKNRSKFTKASRTSVIKQKQHSCLIMLASSLSSMEFWTRSANSFKISYSTTRWPTLSNTCVVLVLYNLYMLFLLPAYLQCSWCVYLLDDVTRNVSWQFSWLRRMCTLSPMLYVHAPLVRGQLTHLQYNTHLQRSSTLWCSLLSLASYLQETA